MSDARSFPTSRAFLTCRCVPNEGLGVAVEDITKVCLMTVARLNAAEMTRSLQK